MIFLLISFIAGVLTVLAPCVLPLLPVIVGGSMTDVRSRAKPYVITISLAISVVLFTLLLKVVTIFIDIPQTFWQYFSGTILIFFGLITLFPDLWERGAIKLNLIVSRKSNTALAQGVKKESFWGDIIIGASLGPVFSSCSPTYFVILATVLPQSFAKGLVDLMAYSIGLSLSLLLISKLGQKLVGKLDGVSDTHGWFKRSLGVLFLLVGIFIATGISQRIELYLAENNSFSISFVEDKLLQTIQGNKNNSIVAPIDSLISADNASSTIASTTTQTSTSQKIKTPSTSLISLAMKSALYPKYTDINNPSGFVNSDPLKLKDIIGKKVVLVDFLTYSCINCQRTFPYLNAWYSKYKDKGLEIVAIHTPEFAFEHKIENVREAMQKFGIMFPVVLDNDYGTWNAYQNQYWPHKFLIDIDGYVRYDHIGEGGYVETEDEIKSLLDERSQKLGDVGGSTTGSNVAKTIPEQIPNTQSTETYFGAFRNNGFLGNGDGGKIYTDTFTLPKTFPSNQFYLGGKWDIEKEYIESGEDTVVAFSYNSTKVYLVAEAPNGATVTIQNGDVANQSSIEVKSATLYKIVDNKDRESSVFYLHIPKGVRLYSLTFG